MNSFWKIAWILAIGVLPLLADEPNSKVMGLMIPSSTARSEFKPTLFVDLAWNSPDGGTITDKDGQSSTFANKDIGKIVYLNSLYYSQLGTYSKFKAFRVGLQGKEVVVNTDFYTKLTRDDLKTLRNNENSLETLKQSYPAFQLFFQSRIDLTKKAIDLLNDHQHLEAGSWSKSYGPVSFILKDGTKYSNVDVWLDYPGICADGTEIDLTGFQDDISVYPPELQNIIKEKRSEVEAAKAKDESDRQKAQMLADQQAQLQQEQAKQQADEDKNYAANFSKEYGVPVSGITQRGSIMARKLIIVKKQQDGTYVAQDTVEGDYLIGGGNFRNSNVGDTPVLRLFPLGSYVVNDKTYTCFTVDGDEFRKQRGNGGVIENNLGIYTQELFDGDASINPR